MSAAAPDAPFGAAAARHPASSAPARRGTRRRRRCPPLPGDRAGRHRAPARALRPRRGAGLGLAGPRRPRRSLFAAAGGIPHDGTALDSLPAAVLCSVSARAPARAAAAEALACAATAAGLVPAARGRSSGFRRGGDGRFLPAAPAPDAPASGVPAARLRPAVRRRGLGPAAVAADVPDPLLLRRRLRPPPFRRPGYLAVARWPVSVARARTGRTQAGRPADRRSATRRRLRECIIEHRTNIPTNRKKGLFLRPRSGSAAPRAGDPPCAGSAAMRW